MNNYHQRIKGFREKRNFTQEYMAEELNTSQRSYSSIENGQTQLTVVRLIEISKILQVDIMQIIGVWDKFEDLNTTNTQLTKSNAECEERKQLYEQLVQTKTDEILFLRSLLSNSK